MRYLVLVSLLCGFGAPDELWEAAKKGDVEAVKAQLAKGADVNARTQYGATALHFAAER